jgi:hypothetical protein
MIYVRTTFQPTIGPMPLRHPVEGWVHIQAEVDHQLDPVAETEWLGSLADEGNASGATGPLACVVYADLRAADVHDVLSRHCRTG